MVMVVEMLRECQTFGNTQGGTRGESKSPRAARLRAVLTLRAEVQVEMAEHQRRDERGIALPEHRCAIPS